MIIQQPGVDGQRFAVRNVDHARFAGAMARHFGNAQFEQPRPVEDFYHLIDHHDEGWLEIDNAPPLDTDSGQPYHLGETPFEYLLQSGKASPDVNEKFSPLCGLVSSMHTYGLYHGRYGLSDAISLDKIPEQWQAPLSQMLEAELARQKQLQEGLDKQLVFYFYKLLQFFDASALYFNSQPEGQRGNVTFKNVPMSTDTDVSITVTETESGYVFDPYPFSERQMDLSCHGYYYQPDALGEQASYPQQARYEDRQTFRICAVSD